jgi:CheY-like chemotaxis protein
MAELLRSTAGPQIDVVVQIAEGVPPAHADRNQLEMAILNLAVNARDAMPSGGTITLSADQDYLSVEHQSGLAAGHYVSLRVADTGCGMDTATLKRAIEPFFSTKGVGKGTGLGLSMVHGLTLQLGGTMSLSSEPGRGTEAKLWLPASGKPVKADVVSSANANASSTTGVVLLVDDEELVRSTTAAMLFELGYQVAQAAAGEDALEMLNGGLCPALVVSDHLMPGMTGTDLLREVRRRCPSAQTLLISGFAEAEGVAPDLPRLTKPFKQADLASALQGLRAI